MAATPGALIAVACPKCHTNLMAQAGGWSQCPSCSFQFFTPVGGGVAPPAAPQLSSLPAVPTSVENDDTSKGAPAQLPPQPVLSQLPKPGMPTLSQLPQVPAQLPAKLPVPPQPQSLPPPAAPPPQQRGASAPTITTARGDGDMSSAVEAAEARAKQAQEEAARELRKQMESQRKGEVQAGPSMRRPDPVDEPAAKVMKLANDAETEVGFLSYPARYNLTNMRQRSKIRSATISRLFRDRTP